MRHDVGGGVQMAVDPGIAFTAIIPEGDVTGANSDDCSWVVTIELDLDLGVDLDNEGEGSAEMSSILDSRRSRARVAKLTLSRSTLLASIAASENHSEGKGSSCGWTNPGKRFR